MSSGMYVLRVTPSEPNAEPNETGGAASRIADALLRIHVPARSPTMLVGEQNGSGRAHQGRSHGSWGRHGRRHTHGHVHGMGRGTGGPATARLLLTLADAAEQLGVSEVGERIRVDQPRASRLVAHGINQGLIEKEPDPADARRARIRLTEAGQKVASSIRLARTQQVADALTDFTEEEQRELAELLGRLAASWE